MKIKLIPARQVSDNVLVALYIFDIFFAIR